MRMVVSCVTVYQEKSAEMCGLGKSDPNSMVLVVTQSKLGIEFVLYQVQNGIKYGSPSILSTVWVFTTQISCSLVRSSELL